MKHIILLLVTFFAFSLGAQESYYWYQGEKIPLKFFPDKQFVLWKNSDNVSSKNKSNIVATLSPYKIQKDPKEYIWSIEEKELSAIQHKEAEYIAPFYTIDSEEVGLSHLFYVKLKKQEDIAVLEKMTIDNQVSILGNNRFMPLWYTLACSSATKGNALQMANKFYESGLFVAVNPDFILKDNLLCVNDPEFGNQWALYNDTNEYESFSIDLKICEAREITTGSTNVIVAVLDTGVELDHPDLTNIYPLSLNANSYTSPSIVDGFHGTACAGIIGATANNGIGIAGIAPDCPIMSIREAMDNVVINTLQARANGINWAVEHGASVISNSWHASAPNDLLNDAIDNALTNGRNGLGCVIVFAAGNHYGNVRYPANYTNDILAVGAVDKCGVHSGNLTVSPNSCDPWCPDCQPGSAYGEQLDVVAPGSNVRTTDTGGGYRYFGGTSAATPHVAGVAALILSVNPGLTQKQVGDIIESTAQKVSDVGGYLYQTVSGRSNGTWNEHVGYGLVNAYAAVQQALNLCANTDVNFTNQTVTTDTTVTSCGDINVQNVNVTNGAKLTLDAAGSTIIDDNFEVTAGATFEIK